MNWDRILWWIAPWVGDQCKAELPFTSDFGSGCSYCMRRKGHPGQHETFNGETFLDGDSQQ